MSRTEKEATTNFDRNKLPSFLISSDMNLCQASYSNRIGIEIIEDFVNVLAHVSDEEPLQIFKRCWVALILKNPHDVSPFLWEHCPAFVRIGASDRRRR